ncbi:hypothetical protein V6R86_10720 [Sphingomonas kaistensis]|uniref:Uncharacterized protein n=1 Tax=Sphingomonas kaistensis TaxID=298708 RepID=A0ABZ2G5J7_9SPHN
MYRVLLTLSSLFLASDALAQEKLDPPVLELTPEWLETNVNPRVLDALVDPDSAKIVWNYSTVLQEATERLPDATGRKVETKVMFALTCGTVNAKNRMGGYNGKTFILVAQWPDRLVMNMDDEAEGLRTMCGDYIRRGVIVPRI